MIRRTRLALLPVAAVLLVTAGCGNDDEKAAASLSDSVRTLADQPGLVSQFFAPTAKQADCIGSGLVDEIGTDRLKKDGLLTDDAGAGKPLGKVELPRQDARSATDVVFGCVDVQAAKTKAVARVDQIPSRLRPCVDKSLTDAVLKQAATSFFAGDEQGAQQRLLKAATGCALGSQGG